MSYNEIPSIVVDSVVLPNKPLSNLEIIDAAKELSIYEFRGVFCETLFLENKIKRMVCSLQMLIAYLMSPIFTIANQSNKTVRCFAVIYVSSH